MTNPYRIHGKVINSYTITLFVSTWGVETTSSCEIKCVAIQKVTSQVGIYRSLNYFAEPFSVLGLRLPKFKVNLSVGISLLLIIPHQVR